VEHVLVPEAPGILCAFGLLTTDLRADFVRTVRLENGTDALVSANATWAELEAAAQQWLNAEGVDTAARSISRSVDMRYRGQNYEIRVVGPHGAWGRASLRKLEEGFRAEHERAYGYSTSDPMQIVSLRVAAVGKIPKVRLHRERLSHSRPRASSRQDVYWERSDRPAGTLVYDRESLRPGQKVHGPAIIEQMDSTTLVPASHVATVDAYRTLHLDMAG
jgi:N-methylhydantoinase A